MASIIELSFCFGIISLTNLGWFGCTDHILNLIVNDVIRKSGEIKNDVSNNSADRITY